MVFEFFNIFSFFIQSSLLCCFLSWSLINACNFSVLFFLHLLLRLQKKLDIRIKLGFKDRMRLRMVGTSQRVNTSDDTVIEDVSNQGRMIDELDKDEGAVLMSEKEEKETKEVKDITGDAQVEGRQVEIYQIDMDHAATVLSMQEDEPKIQEAVEVVTTAKLITEVVTTISETVNATAGVPAGTVTPASVKVVVPSTRRRGGVVIRDPKEESCVKIR
nr:hypothetical protein [Tanacetum cinerariifolium]